MTGPTEAQKFGMMASMDWWSDNRELTVSFDQKSLESSLVAWVKLHQRDKISNNAPSFELYYRIMQTAFLNIFDAQTIVPTLQITSLGWDAIEQMRRDTGIGAELLVAPAPVLSAEDQLRAEIQKDWVSISGSDVRKKANQDSNYRRLLEEMLASDEIAAPTSGRSNFIKIDGPDLEAGNRY